MRRKVLNAIKWFLLSTSIALFIGILINLGYIDLTPGSDVCDQKVIDTKKDGWVLPKSSSRGLPFVTNKKLSIFDVDTKQTHDTLLDVRAGAAASGFGNSGPLHSKDLFYTAFIDGPTGDLWIISNETFEKKRATYTGGVSYISEWSPDSRKIVFYTQRETLQTRRDGPIPWEGGETFTQQRLSGFMLFDIYTGELTVLSPIDHFVSFVGPNAIISKSTDMSDRLVLFTLDTFEADYGLISETFGFGSNQFSLSPSGKHWAFTYSKKPTDDANIMYSKFPAKEGKTLDSGSWAEVQWPKISPDGTKLIYQRKYGYKFPGMPQNSVHLVNLETQKNTKLVEGGSAEWVGNDQIILWRLFSEKSPYNKVILLDINTLEEFEIMEK